MLQATFNIFDAVVMGIIFLSAVLAFFRGFMKEILSLLAWLGAAIITLYAFPTVTEKIEPYVGNEKIAAGFATLGTYIIALLTISIFNSILLKYLKTDEAGGFDKILGLAFGVLRGAFIVSLGFLLFMLVVPKEENYPLWVKEAKTQPYASQGALLIAEMAPDYLKDMKNLSETIKEAGEKRMQEQEEREPYTIERTFPPTP